MHTEIERAYAHRDAAITSFVKRRDFARQVATSRKSVQRLARVRKTTGFGTLPQEELAGYVITAIGIGYDRALIARFGTEHGLTPEWWADRRREIGVYALDRSADRDIILAAFPEFENYIPAPDLTDDEVLDGAISAFRDEIAGAGTTYRELELQDRHAQTGRSGVDIPEAVTADGKLTLGGMILGVHKSGSSAPADNDRDFVDPSAQAMMERLADGSDEDPLGPSATRALSVAVAHYGPNGMFWFAEWMWLPRRYTEILRLLGATEKQMGRTAFERVKRDMVRKLPEVEVGVMAILADEPEVVDTLYRLRAKPAPEPTEKDAQAISLYRAEKAKREKAA